MSIREELYKWRDGEADKRSIDAFRVLPNTTLDEIARLTPKTKEELCNIKGIKDMKFAQYGKEILNITSGNKSLEIKDELVESSTLKDSYSVGQYLNIINVEIGKIKARVKGEVVSFQISGNALYFSIKDKNGEGMLSVFMWSTDYKLCGVDISEGLEVIVEGYSEIYKPSGKFSLRARTIELVGEGALKKAYNVLKKKLEDEGIFKEEYKKKLPSYPSKIGVITSKQGAVIHDFLNNLGKFGYSIIFADSRVEGILAARDILGAIKTMSKKDIDVLVIIRGGGSLESLQAFNNELVVRAISEFKVPVICAIGHDKDVPLSQLAADYSPSTPSMCTAILNESWDLAKYQIESSSRIIISKYSSVLNSKLNIIIKAHGYLGKTFSNIQNITNAAIYGLDKSVILLQGAMQNTKKDLINNNTVLLVLFNRAQENLNRTISEISNILEAYDPLRQLKLGYSLIYLKDKILRSTSSLVVGDTINANLADGSIVAEITKINKYD